MKLIYEKIFLNEHMKSFLKSLNAGFLEIDRLWNIFVFYTAAQNNSITHTSDRQIYLKFPE